MKWWRHNEKRKLLPSEEGGAGGVLARTAGRALPNLDPSLVAGWGLVRREYGGVRAMMGYKYDDIQRFGEALKWAQHYTPLSDKEAREGLLEVWDFFEGLLGEGYIQE